jgi:hypothetical protein
MASSTKSPEGAAGSRPARAFLLTSAHAANSRSFALVIQQLPNPLRDAICIFYLVLRGLDTVEDDMKIPVAIKVPELLKFHESIYDRCGAGAHSEPGPPSPPLHWGGMPMQRTCVAGPSRWTAATTTTRRSWRSLAQSWTCS